MRPGSRSSADRPASVVGGGGGGGRVVAVVVASCPVRRPSPRSTTNASAKPATAKSATAAPEQQPAAPRPPAPTTLGPLEGLVGRRGRRRERRQRRPRWSAGSGASARAPAVEPRARRRSGSGSGPAPRPPRSGRPAWTWLRRVIGRGRRRRLVRRGRALGRAGSRACGARPARSPASRMSSSACQASRASARPVGRLLGEQPLDPLGEPRVDLGIRASAAAAAARRCARAGSPRACPCSRTGTVPVSSSYAITPVEYRSVCGPISLRHRLLGGHVGGRADGHPALGQRHHRGGRVTAPWRSRSRRS